MATWTPAWKVWPEGEGITEYRVSRTGWSVTVRKLGATKGGERYSPKQFEHYFGRTPAEAIEKYLEHHQLMLGKSQRGIEICEMLIRRGEALAQAHRAIDKQRQDDLNISFRPTKEQLEAMWKLMEES
jgi:hypothetical protein